MESTVEKRLTDLEAQVAALTARVLNATPPDKDWQRMIGTWPDDELSREIDRRGAEWRQESNDE